MISSNVYCPQVRGVFERGHLHALEAWKLANEEHEGEELCIIFRCQTDLGVPSCGAGAFSSKVPGFTSNTPFKGETSNKVVTCETSNLILPKEQCITSEFSNSPL